ncbi:MAG TPA: chemotaxis-specific protein-glutamate methyltransferase CheB [Terracidiphilus sp.]|jgi:two-component system response regulator WspF|nr:chemotaxis-specific protein-glutamate methyltransferase CheB [Terracidiphilus sp.]
MNVAIVNDSRMAAEILRRVLAGLPEFSLLWTAYSGEEAIQLCEHARPDIILMDLVMPGIDGAETTRRIMQSAPCVILVVTATTVGNRDKVFEAMGHGALDAVNTPVLGAGQDLTGAEPLIQKLRTVARLVGAQRADRLRAPHRAKPLAPDTQVFPLVALGASTGGPQALAEILSGLPAHFPASLLVVQHVDAQFTPGLAAWLQNHSRIPVDLAHQGEMLRPGHVWIASSSEHLVYADGLAHYTPAPRNAVHSPSIDVLFSSLAQPHQAPRVGVLLTGMGRDGAEGLRAMRRSGALTIAQDAATSVVYGMPRAAAELKAAAEILPLTAIAPRICSFIAAYPQTAPTPVAGTADSPRPSAESTGSIAPAGRGS